MKVWVMGLVALLMAATVGCGGKTGEPQAGSSSPPTPAEVQKIAQEAYTYGFPMVDMNRIMYDYYVDTTSSQYAGQWNDIHNIARVYTPSDTAVQTPNSDTPYSQLGLDLRSQPMVLTLPKVDEGRYFSVSFIDAYTYDYALLGSRTTGNGGGTYLIAGPGWKDEKPAGIDEVITSATELNQVIFRTQLFNPADMDNVKKIQAGYKLQTLSDFEKKPAPAPAPVIDFPKPLTPEAEKTSLDFYKLLDFSLEYAPVMPTEKDIRARFASIGLTGEGTFDPSKLDDATKAAFEAGMKASVTGLADFIKTDVVTGKVGSGKLFGTPEELGDNYLYRMAGAEIGIFGLPGAEAMYFPVKVDSAGVPLNAANGAKYTVTFPAGQLPPVNAFWSTTMYRMPQSLLVENPINRYLINSPMTDQLKKNEDGSITLYLQNTSPGADKESNWLPAPGGPFQIVTRLYWPKPEVLDGKWLPPKVVKS